MTVEQGPLALARGQFVYGTHRFGEASGWRAVSLGDGRVLSSHPDTQVTLADAGPIRAALIGMALDPRRPDDANADILRRWLDGAPDPADLPARTFHAGGRWVLIVRHGDREIAFGDCAMTLPIFHGTPESAAQPWIASSDVLLASAAPTIAEEDPWFRETMLEGVCRTIRKSGIIGMPVDRTLYSAIRSLPPNHTLDLRTGQRARFWPLRPIERVRLADAVEHSAVLLSGLLQAAANRAPLTLGLTAGHDSRTLAAAMKHVEHPHAPLLAHTITNRINCPPGHFDITTGQRIAEIMGWPFRVLPSFDEPDPSQTELARTISNYQPRLHMMKYGPMERHGLDRVLHVNGNVSEIVRSGWSAVREVRGGRYTLNDILVCCTFEALPGAGALYAPWLKEATELKHATGLDELERLYWEWKLPRTVGEGHSLRTLFTDIFSAYACNELIQTQLGVHPRHRGRGRDDLHSGVVRRLAPELADLPYNPFPAGRQFKQNMRHWAAVRYNRVKRFFNAA